MLIAIGKNANLCHIIKKKHNLIHNKNILSKIHKFIKKNTIAETRNLLKCFTSWLIGRFHCYSSFE